MNIKSINKLSAIICGLIFLPLPLLAQNKIVTSSTTEGPASYHDVADYSALDIRGNGVIYDGTDITLTATYNTDFYSPNVLAKGAYVTDQATLSLTDSAITTTGFSGHGILLDNYSTGTVSNVNIKTTGNDSRGVFAQSDSTLTLTGGTITTTGSWGYGIALYDTSTGTVNSVNIETKGVYSIGVSAGNYSTLTLTDSDIITGSNNAIGISLVGGVSGTIRNVNIETKGYYGYGVSTEGFSTLTLTGGTITTANNNSYGISLVDGASGTVSNVNIKTKGNGSHGVNVALSSTLTLTDSDISATGDNSNAIYLFYNNTVTVSLNKNTLTGNITVEDVSTLALTGSNGTVITGDIIKDASSTVNLTLSNNAAFIGSGTVSNLVLGDNAILGYTDNGPLVIDGTLPLGDNIVIDFSNFTETGLYTILDWSNATALSDITDAQFNIATPGVEGDFTVNTENKQLTFNATAIPEPFVYFLLGTGIALLLLTARRRNAQS
jgi:autotransporter family porin